LALSVGIEGVLILSAVAAGFALSPAPYGANRYDFHLRSPAVPPAPAAFFFFRRKNLATGLVCTGLLALAQDEPAAPAARELARTPSR
jgi:uncharacterized membrane protein